MRIPSSSFRKGKSSGMGSANSVKDKKDGDSGVGGDGEDFGNGGDGSGDGERGVEVRY